MTSTTSTFHLPNTHPPIPITHPACMSQDQLLAFPAFKTWLNTLRHSLSLQRDSSTHPFHKSPYSLKSIEIQSFDLFSGQRLGFLKLKAEVSNEDGEHLPGSVFMRGGSVAMLIILTPSDGPRGSGQNSGTHAEYAILTLQPRIPAGSLSFIELPAGMIDDSGTFAGAAAREVHEETGLEISSDELIDMTQLASQMDSLPPSAAGEEQLQSAMYPSPGGSDEFMPIFLARKSLPTRAIDELKGKLTGLRDHGEKITLKIVPLHEVWKVAWRDGKTLAAMALYEGLRAEGRI
jgi:8-oxo-dGTP pyrophosphatase MutT (NUDIX family)